MLASNQNGWCEAKCTFTAFYLAKTYQDAPLQEGINIENIGGKKLLLYPPISKGQSGWLLWAPAHQSINVKEEIQGIALKSGSSHFHLSNSYLPSVQSWHWPNSVSAHEASTSSSALSPPTPPAGKKDGHSAGWLSGPLCPPNIPQSPLPQFPPLTRGFSFHCPFDVSHSAADLFLICVTGST